MDLYRKNNHNSNQEIVNFMPFKELRVEQPKETETKEDHKRFLGFDNLTKPTDEIKKLSDRFLCEGELQKVEKILSFLGNNKNLDYFDLERRNPEEWKKLFRNRTAEEILKTKISYGCADTVTLFLAITRGCGIPSKFIEGKRIGKSGSHSWAQVLIGEKWVDVDPTKGLNGIGFNLEKSKHGPYKVISESLGPSDSIITSYKDWKKIEKIWDYKRNEFKK